MSRLRLAKKRLNSQKVFVGCERAKVFFLLAPIRCSNWQALSALKSFQTDDLLVTVFKPSSRLLKNHPHFRSAHMWELGACTLVCAESSQISPGRHLCFLIQRAKELEVLLVLASTWINRSVLDSARLGIFVVPTSFSVCKVVRALLNRVALSLLQLHRNRSAKTIALVYALCVFPTSKKRASH